MLNIPPEEKERLEKAVQEVAQILYKYTEPEKLENFESIECEVREQVINHVSPNIGKFFFQREKKSYQERQEQ